MYLLYSKGPDDILWQQLSLYQCHLDVSVDLRIIRPVFTALHLRVTKPSVWQHPHKLYANCNEFIFTMLYFTAHIHIRISASCQAIIFSNKDNCHITLAPICHLIFQHFEAFLSNQNEICFILVSAPGQGSAVNGESYVSMGEFIHTLLLFHSHVDNVKMSLKVDCAKTWNRTV